jgi:hypothetical protein
MDHLHPPTEVARTLLVVMRRGSLSAAENIIAHKHETIGRWLRTGDGRRDTGAYRGSGMDGRSIGRKLGGCIGMRSVWASVGVRAECLRQAWA